jgi:DNA-binding winged helix-turn-helix (wHTH) protein
MVMARLAKQFYEFGPFRLYPREELLLRDHKPVSLTSKAFLALIILVENDGCLMRTDELIDRVWADVAVSQNNLNKCICAVRKALGDNARKAQFIETVPWRGYRFIARVTQGLER